MSSSNVSYDLIWQISRDNSAYLLKRKNYGGVEFSTEPLNSTGLYTKAASGFANSHAAGVVKTPEGIKLLIKDGKDFNHPSKEVKASNFDFKSVDQSKADNEELQSAVALAYALDGVSV